MQRILISRTDNMGDVILALPMAKVIKQYFPIAEVYFLVRPYARPIVENCPDLDGVLIDTALLNLEPASAIQQLRDYQFDVFINVFTSKPLLRIVRHAIAERIGTASRWYNWIYCNKRVFFSRVHSTLHEAQLNLKLLRAVGIRSAAETADLIPTIKLATSLPARLANLLDNNRFNLIIHPGSHGNGKEWPVDYYLQLIEQLPQEKVKIFITGTDKEQQRFEQSLLQPCADKVVNLMQQLTLEELIMFIAHADGLLASGTGPLHLAAALGINTLGVFPDYPTSGPRRWRPLGLRADYLVASQACSKQCQGFTCDCMRSITVAAVLQKLNGFFSLGSK